MAHGTTEARSRLALWIATGGYTGYVGVVPGTVGSVVGVVLYLPMVGISVPIQLMITGAVFVLGVWASNRAEAIFKLKDARPIVIDEIVGMWISLISVANGITHFIAAFLLFRIFDIVKPFPARQAERLKGGLGVMTDDVIAGIYANAALQVGLIFISAIV